MQALPHAPPTHPPPPHPPSPTRPILTHLGQHGQVQHMLALVPLVQALANDTQPA